MITILEPWHRCDDPRFEEELRREICSSHVLHGVAATIIARRQDRDDFLFELPDGRFAIVHLTWARESDPRWPATEVFDSIDELCTIIQHHVDEWKELEGS
jgi:hypothetical protein